MQLDLGLTEGERLKYNRERSQEQHFPATQCREWKENEGGCGSLGVEV